MLSRSAVSFAVLAALRQRRAPGYVFDTTSPGHSALAVVAGGIRVPHNPSSFSRPGSLLPLEPPHELIDTTWSGYSAVLLRPGTWSVLRSPRHT